MSESRFDVVVVGAGIVGASTAYHLKKQGVKSVLLLERAAPAAGGTGKSAAIVRQHYSTPLMARLALESIGMLAQIEAKTKAKIFQQNGWHMLVPQHHLETTKKNIKMQQRVGVQTQLLSDKEIEEQLPWLNTKDVAAVVYEKAGGYADSVRLTEHFVDEFKAAGGVAQMKVSCRSLLREGKRITGVQLEDGIVKAEAVINAAGPWAKSLAEQANIEMPMQIVREQDAVFQAKANRPLPIAAVSNAIEAIYVRPMGLNRFLVGQGFPKEYFLADPYNFREAADEGFPELMYERAVKRIHSFEGMSLITSYAALYDVTPDWYPFIGPRDAIEGYYDACGGSGHGFKTAPAIGKELAAWVKSGSVASDFACLSFDRLVNGKPFVGSYGGNRG